MPTPNNPILALTPSEWQAIANALVIAAEAYRADAAAVPALAEQFGRQAAEALALAAYIEENV